MGQSAATQVIKAGSGGGHCYGLPLIEREAIKAGLRAPGWIAYEYTGVTQNNSMAQTTDTYMKQATAYAPFAPTSTTPAIGLTMQRSVPASHTRQPPQPHTTHAVVILDSQPHTNTNTKYVAFMGF